MIFLSETQSLFGYNSICAVAVKVSPWNRCQSLQFVILNGAFFLEQILFLPDAHLLIVFTWSDLLGYAEEDLTDMHLSPSDHGRNSLCLKFEQSNFNFEIKKLSEERVRTFKFPN